jgi:hypothetical protein
MERSGIEGWRHGEADQASLQGLVELVVAVSDETDDLWEIDDRVDAMIRESGAPFFS